MTSIAAFGLVVPQASAVATPKASGVTLLPEAKSETRAIAAADPQAVQAMASLCGSGYALTYAERLPDATRFGTLFTYKNAAGASCAVFDNNSGFTKYMKLKLCENSPGQPCATDEGNFSQYAGPVRVKSGFCATVTAIMKDSKSSHAALIDRVTTVPPCD
ncbi:hypothetical protein AB0952_25760 [Streptomyces caniferus]|uniref:hypothetical protein n=1 Tax=Streptomyces caniferus TaxID=285557 RepID=UPI0033D67D00